ncbi:MAG: acetylglutamate kinase, partial [Dehalococcoidia bacterium]|nr:acetylglutamate kinase [Dehalococcoidia bacterium]
AVGISGADGALIQARIKDAALGYIGEIERVEPRLITTLLAAGYLPVISPASYHDTNADNEPLLLNVNGDTVAGEIACAIGAAKLIYLTDVDGIRGADGMAISDLDQAGILELLANGVASGGMVPKLKSCLTAIRSGIVCHIVDGRRPHTLTEVISGTTIGTTIRQRE